MNCNDLNSIGLIFDIIGVLLLFKYGLPNDLNKKGLTGMSFVTVNKEEVKKYKRYKRWSYIALSAILIGFIIQILSNQTYLCAT